MKSDAVAICRSCGWYASLGTFVEVDPNWEADPDAADPAYNAQQKSHLRVWIDLLPRWSWVIIACVMFVVVESVVARIATPTGSGLRTAWSLGQLALGVLAAVGCHIFNFLVLAADDADFGILDLVLKPLKLWIRAVRELPTRLWVANSAASGLTAAVMSIVVIGGIPYERFWDWGFEAPPKQNLMGAVMDRAKELENRGSADSLEDAVGDFAGSANVDPNATPANPTPSKPRRKTDCVILGYDLDREGRLAALLLGAVYDGELAYAGRVKPKMPDDELAQLLQKLVATRTIDPFIPIEAKGTWVEPIYSCRVSYVARQTNGRLSELEWERLLGEMRMP